VNPDSRLTLRDHLAQVLLDLAEVDGLVVTPEQALDAATTIAFGPPELLEAVRDRLQEVVDESIRKEDQA
jgi:hypothetical protein